MKKAEIKELKSIQPKCSMSNAQACLANIKEFCSFLVNADFGRRCPFFKPRKRKTEEIEITETLMLKNSYITYPWNWIALHDILVPDSEAEYAGMLGVANLGRSDSPVFIFGSDVKLTNDYPEEYCNKLYDACENAWPEFKDIRIRETIPSLYGKINGKDHAEVRQFREVKNRTPEIIIYPVPELGDQAYGTIQTEEDAPYGVVLKRI